MTSDNFTKPEKAQNKPAIPHHFYDPWFLYTPQIKFQYSAMQVHSDVNYQHDKYLRFSCNHELLNAVSPFLLYEVLDGIHGSCRGLQSAKTSINKLSLLAGRFVTNSHIKRKL